MGIIGNYVIVPLISIIVFLIGQRIWFSLRPKAKVVWYSPEPNSFHMQREQRFLYTQTIFIKNNGKETALAVEITLLRKPDAITLNPWRKYQDSTSPNGQHTIVIDNLGAGELFMIQLLDCTNKPSLPVVRSNSGLAAHRERISL